MQERLDPPQPRGPREAAARGEGARAVRIGIGLNTGDCCVGNVGSPQRFDYSILGDVVNVASRLEGTTKIYGVPIIAGERTASGAALCLPRDRSSAKLRGKERPERLFALLGDEATATSVRFGELKSSYAAIAPRCGPATRLRRPKCIDACRALGWRRSGPARHSCRPSVTS